MTTRDDMAQGAGDATGDAGARRRITERIDVRLLLIAPATFLLGWAGENALDEAKKRWFPDAAERRAEEVRAQISKRTAAIEGRLEKMDELLRDADGDLDGEALRALLEEAGALVEQSRNLAPAVSEASRIASAFALSRVRQKGEELQANRYSSIPDAVLDDASGMSLCGGEFSFGGTLSSLGRVRGVLSDAAGEQRTSTLDVGESLSLAYEDRRATVTFVGHDEGKLGYDVKCASEGDEP